MAVIALTSASGSPGVTTTALGLALLWPRPVLLVEADPTGGSGLLAGYFRGTREYDGGLIELALTVEHASTTRSPRSSAAHRGHQRLVRRRHPLAHPGRRAARSVAAARRGAGRPGVDRPGRHRRRRPARTGRLARAAARRRRPDAARHPHHPAGAVGRALVGGLGRSDRQLDWHQAGVLLVGEGQPYERREVARSLEPARGRHARRRPRVALRCSPAERTPPKKFETGAAGPRASTPPSPRSTRPSRGAAASCWKESRS